MSLFDVLDRLRGSEEYDIASMEYADEREDDDE